MSAPAGVSPRPSRRLLDLVVSAAALITIGPVLAALAIAVRLSSPGPALFRQVRLGQGARPFVMYKFRSMRADAAGPELTVPGDIRITFLGAFLRRSSLDELPQLVNVLRGEMTLVGPRPETPDLAARYRPADRWVFAHRPGMTGPGQLFLRDPAVLPTGHCDEDWYVERVVPRRLALDRAYLERPSVRATVALLLRSLRQPRAAEERQPARSGPARRLVAPGSDERAL